MSIDDAARVLAQYPGFENASLRLLAGGLINQTYLASTGSTQSEKLILQGLNPIFKAEVCLDIHALTEHLSHKGMVTPVIMPTTKNTLFVNDEKGERTWRALTYIKGQTHHVVNDGRHAHAAGALVGKWHQATLDFKHEHHFSRGDVHDFSAHQETLKKALQQKEHRLYSDVAPLADAALKAASALPDFSHLPKRFAHGDLKISNLLFGDRGRGICLVDLDTIGQMVWPFEMGDALRSWCNPGREDQECAFDLKRFTGALFGYASTFPNVTKPEYELLVSGAAQITLELTMRFLADALNESYFGFDGARFESRGAHNLARAKGQWALFQSIMAQQKAAEDLVREAFAQDRPSA